MDANLNEVARLHPEGMSADLPLEATWTATMELAEDDAPVGMHDFVEVFTPRGSAGIFRATNIDDTKRSTTTVTLMHAIDTLSDSVWSGQTDYDGTVAGFIAAVLAQQPVVRWQLGTCADNNDYKKAGINYDRLSELLEELQKEEFGYYFSFDFTTWPWTLNFVAQGSTVTSEFRLSRNVESCEITRSDEELCNRLYLSVNEKDKTNGVTVNKEEIKTYNNAASQAIYGIVEKTADIDLENVVDADTWAADFLARRAHPGVQIVIDGWALQAITGETWDEARLGEMARVSLPDYAETLDERVVGISYPELIFADGDDVPIERVTVQLANHTEPFDETIANLKKDQKKTARGGRAGGRGGASGEELENWAIVVQHHGNVMDDTGVTELYESGIEVDAQSGVRIWSLAQGFVSQHAEIKVNSEKIALVVDGNNVIKAAQIVAAINSQTGQSTVLISADKITLDGTTIVSDLLAGRSAISKIWATDADIGTLNILPGGAISLGNSELVMERNAASWQSKTVVTAVSITDATVNLDSARYFLYAPDSTSQTPSGSAQGRLVTSRTNGSHSVSTETIYYLGRPAPPPQTT